MADNFIPMVSNTPPPLDDFDDDCDDFQQYGNVNRQWTDDVEFDEFSNGIPTEDSPQRSHLSLSFLSCKSDVEIAPVQREHIDEKLTSDQSSPSKPDKKQDFAPFPNSFEDNTAHTANGFGGFSTMSQSPNSPKNKTADHNDSYKKVNDLSDFGEFHDSETNFESKLGGAEQLKTDNVIDKSKFNFNPKTTAYKNDDDSSDSSNFQDSQVDLPSKLNSPKNTSIFDKSDFEEVQPNFINKKDDDSSDSSNFQDSQTDFVTGKLKNVAKTTSSSDKSDFDEANNKNVDSLDFGHFDGKQTDAEITLELDNPRKEDVDSYDKPDFVENEQFPDEQLQPTVSLELDTGLSETDDDFGNFDSFRTSEETDTIAINKDRENDDKNSRDFGVFTNTVEDLFDRTSSAAADDGFADFASFDQAPFSSFPATDAKPASPFETASSFDQSKSFEDGSQASKGDGDDFGDFGSAQFFPQPPPPTQTTLHTVSIAVK